MESLWVLWSPNIVRDIHILKLLTGADLPPFFSKICHWPALDLSSSSVVYAQIFVLCTSANGVVPVLPFIRVYQPFSLLAKLCFMFCSLFRETISFHMFLLSSSFTIFSRLCQSGCLQKQLQRVDNLCRGFDAAPLKAKINSLELRLKHFFQGFKRR